MPEYAIEEPRVCQQLICRGFLRVLFSATLLTSEKNVDKESKLAAARKTRDDFLDHLGKTLTPDQLAQTMAAADKLFELALKPGMLNVFAMVNAELTVLYLDDTPMFEAPLITLPFRA